MNIQRRDMLHGLMAQCCWISIESQDPGFMGRMASLDRSDMLPPETMIVFATWQEAQAATAAQVPAGAVVWIQNHALAGDGGGFIGEVMAADDPAYPGQGRIRPIDSPVRPEMFGAKGDGLTDDTAILQQLVDHHDAIWFSRKYRVTNLQFRRANGRYYGRARFVGADQGSHDAVIELMARKVKFDDLSISASFNPGYTSAMRWHSTDPHDPAQFGDLRALEIDNALCGLVFGAPAHQTAVTAAQSENHIAKFRTRGVQIPLVMNQPQGFLFISDSTLLTSKNEWDIYRPGAYHPANSCVLDIREGTLTISGSEILLNDTAEGAGILCHGGSLLIGDSRLEITPCNFLMRGGDLMLNNCTAYFGNGTATPWMDIAATAKGQSISLSGLTMRRPPSMTDGASHFIQHNDNADYDIALSSVTLDHQLGTYIFGAGGTHDYWTRQFLIAGFNVRDTGPARRHIRLASNSRASNILRQRGVDCDGYTQDGWHVHAYKGHAAVTIAADAPQAGPRDDAYRSCLRLQSADGYADLQTIDPRAPESVRATGITVPGSALVQIGAWVRADDRTTIARLLIIGYDDAGTRLTPLSFVDTPTIGTDWYYFEGIQQLSPDFVRIGISLQVQYGAARLTGVSIVVH